MIFMCFMVDSLVCRLPMPFMVRSDQTDSSVYRRTELSTHSGTAHPRSTAEPTGRWDRPRHRSVAGLPL